MKTFIKILLIISIFLNTTFQLFSQNEENPVGKIPAVFNVSPNGASSYSIPIEVVPGTQGVQPNLTISYNSQSGLSNIGEKWSLTGLSFITRSGQIPWFDNNTTRIQLNNTDKFSLDGNRLLVLNGGVYGSNGTQYGTEVENFARITSYGTLGNGPQYFNVVTDEGNVLEYGNTTDSRIVLGSTCMIWALKKMTDPNGNYMSFFYSQQNGELLIDSILYTKNDNIPMNHYAKVSFSYINDNEYKNTFFYGGNYSVSHSKILKTISVYYENSLVRKYDLNYSTSNLPRLTDVTLYGEDGTTHFNSTVITWGNEVNNVITQNLTGLPNGRMLIGDFNGDGLSDYISYAIYESGSYYWKLYINGGNNNYTFHSQGIHKDVVTSDGRLQMVPYVSDVDGDGADEMTIAERFNSAYSRFDFRIIDFNVNGFTNNQICTLNVFRDIKFGDFSGDGSCDIFFVDGLDNTCKTYFNNQGIVYNGTFPITWDKINLLNALGNGKTTLQLVSGFTSYNYEYNISSNMFVNVFNQTFIFDKQFLYFGDFNGDGYTDLLERSGVYFYMSFGLGNGLYSIPINVTSLNVYLRPDIIPIIGDFNGDGKDDIILPSYNSGSRITNFYIHYSQGFFNNVFKYNSNEISFYGSYVETKFFNLGDHNGDGKIDLFIKRNNDAPFVLFFHKSETSNFVEQIVDGLGSKIQIEYKEQYLKCATIPIDKKAKSFLYLTNKVNTSNGIQNETNQFEYIYSNPIYSSKRLSFLGFNKVIKKDIANTVTDSIISSYYYYNQYGNPPYGNEILLPVRNVKVVNYTKVSSEEFDSRVFSLSNNRFILYSYQTTSKNFINNTKVTNDTRLTSDGRMLTNHVQNYELNSTNYIKGEKNNYLYTSVVLPNSIQSTKPLSVINEKFTNGSSIVVRDTTKYEYYSNGRLHKIRNANADREIITSYNAYLTVGLPQTKVISAIGCESRSELYGYDNKYRFITSIRNDLLQYVYNTYNPKTGSILNQTDINNLVTYYNYNTLGALIKTTYPDGTFDTISYHWVSDLNYGNAKYCSKYSTLGAPLATTYYDILGREIYKKVNNTFVESSFNSKGQIVKKSLPYFSGTVENDKIWITYTYDNYARIQTIIGPNSNLTYSYSSRYFTVQDNLRNTSTTKTYNATGELISVSDPGGVINYSELYITENNKIKLKNEISSNGSTTTIYSDLWGNKLSMIEPNSGTTVYEYNNFNELTSVKDAKQNKTNFSYDKLGRVVQEQYYLGNTLYETYDYEFDYSSASNFGKGLLANVKKNNNIVEHYEYDNKSRVVLNQKTIDNTTYSESYSYNSLGQLETLTYPNTFSTTFNYSSIGQLEYISKSSNNSILYKIYNRNVFESPTRIGYGNNLTTDYIYNSYGILTQLKTGNKINPFTGQILNPTGGVELAFLNDSTIQNMQYSYNTFGIMTSRNDKLYNQKEDFAYDNLDRLTSFYQGHTNNSGLTHTFSYNNNGNIYNNTQTGAYSYSSSKPHAVTNVELTSSNQSAISENQSDIKYNIYNQPDTITEGDYETFIFYGANQQRQKMVAKKYLENGGIEESTWYYINANYEKEIDKDGNVRHYNYIYGEDGLIAVCVQSANADSIYYVHKDHLGSYNIVTNQLKQTIRRVHYDPWGNPKCYNNWTTHDTLSLIATNSNFRTTRGFTGHEHYPQYKIINMNGRLYDPVVARFFSPDNFVQSPDFTQCFNRYSYCLNNPLMYTDPSGESALPWIIGADILSGGVLSLTATSTILGTLGGIEFASGGLFSSSIATTFLASNQFYEIQKTISPIAIKPPFLGFGSSNSIGFDVSLGMQKLLGIPSYRFHFGASYLFGNNPYGGYNGWETRSGVEFNFLGVNLSGTRYTGGFNQTTNTLSFGGPFFNINYENDYMFGLGAILGKYNADNGDRWRSGAVSINVGPISANLNMFTGDPDVGGKLRSRYNYTKLTGGDKEYYYGNSALDPSLRAGVLSIGFGPFRFGANSESIRHTFQNRFAHDFLMKGNSKWFLPLSLTPSLYFYFGYGSGNSLW